MLASSAPHPGPRRIVLLGSTGSIGTQTLDVVARLGSERAQILALAAHRNVSLLVEQAAVTGAERVGVTDSGTFSELQSLADDRVIKGENALVLCSGDECLVDFATLRDADTVVVAVAGAAGLKATMAALKAGKRVCIATKEVLVAAGELVMATAEEHGATILPIDSEHSAVFQCIQGYRQSQIERLWITASGGPFRTWTSEQIELATPADALNHPIWKMGGKISVDSATLMNKGLEIIEAYHLFGIPMDSIEVVLHPQSVVHSFVEMKDGALLCQMGLPDMRLPIQIALMYPEKVDIGLPRLRPDEMQNLTWEKPDHERFPAIMIARDAARTGGTAPAILNAANEAAVAAFLSGSIPFPEICIVVKQALAAIPVCEANSIEAIVEADQLARDWVAKAISTGKVKLFVAAPLPSRPGALLS